ncbi:DUF3237 domain-containing protein [Luteimonas sp. SX5]|uniref:DUF3237 domain-containing protein n=1 Tax=Luteimonas galliterrae TaxID=2940486 RepID=A0ABT0MH91_9GAMM|nr:DUF3237 domain-containing protein [Luteimonas galliterrae]MCL1634242.1 DUF3237 domain-containing protein [Luteimonas galliterrae]
MSHTPSTRLEHEYLMTLHAPVAEAPQQVDGSLTIFHSDRGWAKGPRIDAAIVAPTGDWLRTLPDGTLRVDARMTLRTGDGAVIHVVYGGVIRISPQQFQAMGAGAMLTSDDIYFVTAPVFQTAHPDYAWLNQVQAVGKVAALKGGEGGYVAYDIFGIR